LCQLSPACAGRKGKERKGGGRLCREGGNFKELAQYLSLRFPLDTAEKKTEEGRRKPFTNPRTVRKFLFHRLLAYIRVTDHISKMRPFEEKEKGGRKKGFPC